MDLQGILNLILGLAGLDISAQVASFQDTFAYSILLWLLNLAGVI